MLFRKMMNDKKGAALVEYGLLVAGIALVTTAGVSILGHKTSDLVSAVAAVLPGAHADDNGAIASGKLIETTESGAGDIAVDTDTIATNTNTARLGTNLGMDNLGTDLVVEAN